MSKNETIQTIIDKLDSYMYTNGFDENDFDTSKFYIDVFGVGRPHNTTTSYDFCKAIKKLLETYEDNIVSLPLDADGVPCRIGDIVYLKDNPGAGEQRIVSMRFTENNFYVRLYQGYVEHDPKLLTHKVSEMDKIKQEVGDILTSVRNTSDDLDKYKTHMERILDKTFELGKGEESTEHVDVSDTSSKTANDRVVIRRKYFDEDNNIFTFDTMARKI